MSANVCDADFPKASGMIIHVESSMALISTQTYANKFSADNFSRLISYSTAIKLELLGDQGRGSTD